MAVFLVCFLLIFVTALIHFASKKRDKQLAVQTDIQQFYVIHKRNTISDSVLGGIFVFILSFTPLLLTADAFWFVMCLALFGLAAAIIWTYSFLLFCYKIEIEGNQLRIYTWHKKTSSTFGDVFFVKRITKFRVSGIHGAGSIPFNAYIIFTGNEHEGAHKFAIFNEHMLGCGLLLKRFESLGKLENN